MKEEKIRYHKIITSKHGLLEGNLEEVWDYRDLIMLFTKRNFITRYKQTILGPAWLFITPIISSLIYSFVFGGIAGIGTDGVPQMVFYLSGNAIWAFFASCVNKNSTTFTANAAVFGKVYFPRLTIPLSNVLTSVLELGIQMVIVFGFMAIYVVKGQMAPKYGLWPIILLVVMELGLMGMGTGIIVSSLTTKYRDLTLLFGFAVQLWMYVTPIVYPISKTSEGLMRLVISANPVTAPVELFRYALVGTGEIMTISLIWSFLFTAVVMIIGTIIFNKVEKTFMDTV